MVIQSKTDKTFVRELRKIECFSIINRGKAWYDTLTPLQLQELKNWYHAWLDVTETKIIPARPKWLNNKIKPEEVVI